MNYNVEATPAFRTQAKRLSKKYPSLKAELGTLSQSLAQNPEQGTSLGKDCYKIRLSIASKGKGKSGGARAITCLVKIDQTVYLAALYDKSEKESISDKELKEIVKEVNSKKQK